MPWSIRPDGYVGAYRGTRHAFQFYVRSRLGLV